MQTQSRLENDPITFKAQGSSMKKLRGFLVHMLAAAFIIAGGVVVGEAFTPAPASASTCPMTMCYVSAGGTYCSASLNQWVCNADGDIFCDTTECKEH